MECHTLKKNLLKNHIKGHIKNHFLWAILLTNLLTALIFSGEGGEAKKEYPLPPLKNGYNRLHIPGKLFFPINPNIMTHDISIFDLTGKLVIEKAYLHTKYKTGKAESSEFDLSGDEKRDYYLIDIPIKVDWKITNRPQTSYLFYPFSQNHKPQKKRNIKNYEVTF